MPKYYRTTEFRSLNREWRRRLKDDKFPDCEDEHGNLKQKDIRTIAWVNREHTHDFFRGLDQLIQTYELPEQHRQILQLYSQGTYIKDIAIRIGRGRTLVKGVVRQYKRILIK